MGALYDMCQKLMQQVESDNPNPMDLLRMKGEIARNAGFMVSLVSAKDPDDPAKMAGVQAAARQLGITL